MKFLKILALFIMAFAVSNSCDAMRSATSRVPFMQRLLTSPRRLTKQELGAAYYKQVQENQNLVDKSTYFHSRTVPFITQNEKEQVLEDEMIERKPTYQEMENIRGAIIRTHKMPSKNASIVPYAQKNNLLMPYTKNSQKNRYSGEEYNQKGSGRALAAGVGFGLGALYGSLSDEQKEEIANYLISLLQEPESLEDNRVEFKEYLGKLIAATSADIKNNAHLAGKLLAFTLEDIFESDNATQLLEEIIQPYADYAQDIKQSHAEYAQVIFRVLFQEIESLKNLRSAAKKNLIKVLQMLRKNQTNPTSQAKINQMIEEIKQDLLATPNKKSWWHENMTKGGWTAERLKKEEEESHWTEGRAKLQGE